MAYMISICVPAYSLPVSVSSREGDAKDAKFLLPLFPFSPLPLTLSLERNPKKMKENLRPFASLWHSFRFSSHPNQGRN